MSGLGDSAFGSTAFSGSGDSAPPPEPVLVEVVDGLGYATLLEVGGYINIVDSHAFAAALVVGGYIQITDAMIASDVATSRAIFHNELVDGVTLQDLCGVVFQLLAVDGFVASDSSELRARKLIAIVDALLAADMVTSKLSAVYVMASAFAAEDTAAHVIREEITDTVVIADLMADKLRGYHALFAQVVMADSVASNARFVIPLVDGFTVGDDASSKGILLHAITEGIGFAAALDVDDGHYYAWVLDAESRAAWHYDNYGFNSFARLGDHYLGAMDDGIYVLDGNDDDGASINATLRTGILTFGTSALKRPSVMYVYAKRDGDLVAKVMIVNPETNEAEAHWYALEGGATAALREDRIEPDGGLESVSLQFELINIDGADFDIDQMRVLAVALNRRY